jgi:rhodanese-related sulfurtransferase
MIRIVLAVALSIALAPPTMSGEFASSVDTANVSERSQTTLGLYLTARDAAAALEMDPGIVLVDVRTRAEFSYAGHADPVDQDIPLRFFSGRFDEKSGAYLYDDNENFLRDFAALMDREGKGSDDPIFVMCRSGGRSAAAVNALAAAGYTSLQCR